MVTLVVALALLFIAGANGIGRLREGPSGSKPGATGAISGVAGLSGAAGIGETNVPGMSDAGSGYQAINSSQTVGGYTTGGHTTDSPTPGRPTGGQAGEDQPTSDQTTTGQPSGGGTSASLNSGDGTVSGQTPREQSGNGSTGDQTGRGRVGGGEGGQGGNPTGQVGEGIATPELPSGVLVVLGLILLLGVCWLNVQRRNALDRR